MLAKKTKSIWLWAGLAALALGFAVIPMASSAFMAAPSTMPANHFAALPAQDSGHSQAQGQSSKDPPFDCSRLSAMQLDKQMNLHAAEVVAACKGERPPKAQPPDLSNVSGRLSPMSYGGPDVNTITGVDTFPSVTQAESFIGVNGNTVVVAYNDGNSAPSNYSGVSYSVNGGATFTRILPSPFATGHGTNYGDPTVVYNKRLNKWYSVWLATACGGQGMGVWESVNGITWTVGACAHNGSSDDRQSMWVDNNTASLYYGRMYISWNNFALGAALQVTYSDNGTTWSAPVTLNAAFIRNVQITGAPDGATSTVFVAACDEQGGGLSPRNHVMYRSTDGGATWTSVTMAANQAAPGQSLCGYFAQMNPIWRYMGWGQPGVSPGGIVHYAYARADGADAGNIYYVRSTNNGLTWSAPFKLNTDTGTREQWMPSLATASGSVAVRWYDRRSTTNDNYEMWANLSNNAGVSWLGDMTLSDIVITQPQQPDPYIVSCYAGDYDYAIGTSTDIYMSWTDGRNANSGVNHEDVYIDKIAIVTPTFTPTPTPTCTPNYSVSGSSGFVTAGSLDTGNHCDDCVTAATLPFPWKLYGQTFSTVRLSSNGTLQFSSSNPAYFNSCLPNASFSNTIFAFWDDLRTDTAGSGIYTSISGVAPNRSFNIEWFTTFYNNPYARAHFGVRLYETSFKFDITYGNVEGSGISATIGVQRGTGNPYYQYSCNVASIRCGLRLIFTPTTCVTPTITPTRTPTRTPTGVLSTVVATIVATAIELTPYPIETAIGDESHDVAAYLDPAGVYAAPLGRPFTIDLRVSGVTTKIMSHQSFINFDPDVLQVVDPETRECRSVDTITPDTTVFSEVTRNEVCNGPDRCEFHTGTALPGTIAFASRARGSEVGDFLVAQITFCALKEDKTTLTWDFDKENNRFSAVFDPKDQLVSDKSLYKPYVIDTSSGNRANR